MMWDLAESGHKTTQYIKVLDQSKWQRRTKTVITERDGQRHGVTVCVSVWQTQGDRMEARYFPPKVKVIVIVNKPIWTIWNRRTCRTLQKQSCIQLRNNKRYQWFFLTLISPGRLYNWEVEDWCKWHNEREGPWVQSVKITSNVIGCHPKTTSNHKATSHQM